MHDSYCTLPAKLVLSKTTELFLQIQKERRELQRSLFQQFKVWQTRQTQNLLVRFLEAVFFRDTTLERQTYSLDAWILLIESPMTKPDKALMAWKTMYMAQVLSHRAVEYHAFWRLYKLAWTAIEHNPEANLTVSGIDVHFLTVTMDPNKDFNEYTARDTATARTHE